jgi:hypothetical protein
MLYRRAPQNASGSETWPQRRAFPKIVIQSFSSLILTQRHAAHMCTFKAEDVLP